MATQDWPSDADFKPSDFSIGADVPLAQWRGVNTGVREIVSRASDRLVASLTWPPCLRTVAARREAFISALLSTGDNVRMPMFHRRTPQGTMSGSPTVNGSVSVGARSITLASALPASMLFVGDFETDTNADGLCDGWTEYNAGSTTGRAYLHSSVAQSGTKSQRLQATVLGSTSADRLGIWRKVTVPSSAIGSTATLSAYMLRDAAHTASGQLHISWRNSGNTEISTTSQSVSVATSLTRYSVSGTVPSGTASADVFLWFHSRSGNSVVFESNIDAVQFEVAGSASPFAGLATALSGDFLGIGGNLLQVAYAGAVANDAGGMTVPLIYPVQKAISHGAAVTWNAPTGVWQLDSVGIRFDYTVGSIQDGIVLPFRQVIV